MQQSLRGFWAALGVVWMLLLAVATGYSLQQHIPWHIVVGVVPAYLWEASLYLVVGIPAARERLSQQARTPARLASLLAISALVSYLLFTVPTGGFSWQGLLVVTACHAASAFWFVLLPRRTASDLGYLLFTAAVMLSRVLLLAYPSPLPRVDLEVLGPLSFARVSLLAVLLLRRLEHLNFSFVPTWREWYVGLYHFLLFAPVAILLAWSLEFARWRLLTGGPAKLTLMVVITFFAMLWVQAVPEEIFFRGLLQQTLRRTWGVIAGLVITSIVFGLTHLPFRSFPNWRFAVLATVAGLFYGSAYTRTGSIRAAMVTHALVTTTWRVFFTA